MWLEIKSGSLFQPILLSIAQGQGACKRKSQLHSAIIWLAQGDPNQQGSAAVSQRWAGEE